MEQSKSYAIRRIVETLIIECVSSLPIYVLIKMDVISSTVSGYIYSFLGSALIFMLLNFAVLRMHFWALHFDIRKYLSVNLPIWGVLTVLSLIGVGVFSTDLYTAVFGYTKPFRKMFGMSNIGSAILFWLIYLAVIVGVIIKTKYFDWRYNQAMVDEGKIPREDLDDWYFAENDSQ